MADWTDGSEYAPLERPAGFASPRAAALAVAESTPHPADGQPPQPPREFVVTGAQPPLEALVPLPPDPRDPATPFDVSGDPVESAWGAAHASGNWQPTQPLGDPVQVTPVPVGGQWAPPSEAPVVPVAPAPMALPNSPTPVTWTVIACLVFGILVKPLAVVLFLVASLLPFTPLAWRPPVRGVFSLVWLGLVIGWLWGSAGLGDVEVDGLAQLGCGAVLLTIVVLWLTSRRRQA